MTLPRLDPATLGLQVRCSTIELPRHTLSCLFMGDFEVCKSQLASFFGAAQIGFSIGICTAFTQFVPKARDFFVVAFVGGFKLKVSPPTGVGSELFVCGVSFETPATALLKEMF